MMRARAAAGAVVAALVMAGTEHQASACGGEFVPPTVNEAVTTDHRMILSISMNQTTLWDEVQFSGAPSSFAWVLPIQGTATVGLSADVLFGTLDALTAPKVIEPQCVPCFSGGGGSAAGGGGSSGGGGGPSGGVTVLSSAVVGPYETVQLSSSSPTALTDWLTAHGFAIPTDESSVIGEYVSGGFNFLAMKLVPGSGVSTMRPVRVTTQGASAVLPLRMVAVGTGATTGITLWVVADGRYEPQNFPFFTISDSQIVWDWTTNTSNYVALRTSMEASLGGAAWQIESSLELAQSTVSGLLQQPVPADGGVQTVSTEYLALDAGAHPQDGGDAAASEEAGAELAASDDLATLFAGITGPNARITRMRSDMAHAGLTADMTLQASSDQTELSNLYSPGSTTGQSPCAVCSHGGGGGGGGGSGGGGSGGGGSAGVGGASSGSSSSFATSASAASTVTTTVTLRASLGSTGSRAGGSSSTASATSGSDDEGSSPGASGGCTASPSTAGDALWASLGAMAGFASFGAARGRRRRARR